MLPVPQALDTVLAQVRRLPAEEVDLAQSPGRVLAEDVASDLEVPPFDRAAMDGYALRSADALTAGVRLRVVDRVRAGQVGQCPVGVGEAVQVMTGAPVPAGADAVQPVERVRLLAEGAEVELASAVSPGQHVAPRGSEMTPGAVVLRAGTRIDPAVVAVLATVGRARVRVARRPRVAVLVTGDELVPVSATPGPGQIRNSNGPAIEAAVALAGAEVVSLGTVPDQEGPLAEAIERGLACDVLLTSGGVSAGEFDLVEPVFDRLGVQTLFTHVAIKPGAPLVFAHRRDTLVFGLPGNPVSALVTFDLFVRAALLRMQGVGPVRRSQVRVTLAGTVGNRSRRRAHLPARVAREGVRLVAHPLPSRGSADVAAHAGANALLLLEPGQTECRAGEVVEALLLPSFAEASDG